MGSMVWDVDEAAKGLGNNERPLANLSPHPKQSLCHDTATVMQPPTIWAWWEGLEGCGIPIHFGSRALYLPEYYTTPTESSLP